jgi:hypothetical protein
MNGTKRLCSRVVVPVAALTLLLLASAVQAQGVDGDLRVGVYSDADETFVGGGILAGLGGSWYFNPNLEYVLVDRGDLFTLNADFHYDLARRSEADIWLGGGVALVERSHGHGADDSDVGLNLLAGIGFLRHRPIRPFLQAKLLLADNTEGVIAFGIRFF